jgi:hypothetical protein
MAVDANQRKFAPVFVLGSPRSGTTLLYDMLLSSGGFAVYLAESNVFNVLGPRFGDFGSRETRKRVLSAWLNSKLFRATGLSSAEIEKRILEDCHSTGDFLRIVMDEMVRAQGMHSGFMMVRHVEQGETPTRVDPCFGIARPFHFYQLY